jgi:hypothetical protein
MGEGKTGIYSVEKEETEMHLANLKQKGDNGFHAPLCYKLLAFSICGLNESAEKQNRTWT